MNHRVARHAGMWYKDNAAQLSEELRLWLSEVPKLEGQSAKAIITPHAGLRYCGSTAAWAWAQVDPTEFNRVVLMGPSHHMFIEGCAIPESRLTCYQTPLGDIPLDIPALTELRQTKAFDVLSVDNDEKEHAIELQLPFLKYSFKSHPFSIVPIVVGRINGRESEFCSLLANLFADPGTLFVVSSDFCHWGNRFRYTYLPSAAEDRESINESIKNLDEEGIREIEAHNGAGFRKHLSITRNTICGRNPIIMLLGLIENSDFSSSLKTKHLRYSQSTSEVKNGNDMCVSYAAIATLQKCGAA